MASEVIAGTVQEAVDRAIREGRRVIQVEAGTVLTADRFRLPENMKLRGGRLPHRSPKGESNVTREEIVKQIDQAVYHLTTHRTPSGMSGVPDHVIEPDPVMAVYLLGRLRGTLSVEVSGTAAGSGWDAATACPTADA
jgi:hypothetical protein